MRETCKRQFAYLQSMANLTNRSLRTTSFNSLSWIGTQVTSIQIHCLLPIARPLVMYVNQIFTKEKASINNDVLGDHRG